MAGLVLQTRHDARWWPESQGLLCRHRYRVFSGFLLCFTFSMAMGGGSSVGRHSLKAPPLLLPFTCCAIGWCIRVVREITLRLVAMLGL